MKKQILLSLVVAMLPLALWAQDDVYFVPKKKDKVEKPAAPVMQENRQVYYRGLDVPLDEYNRMNLKSSYQILGKDSLGNDIIEFDSAEGNGQRVDTVFVYQDDEDFRYTSRMGRFDDFYGWYHPWFYDYRFYGPWGYYHTFYDPWFYDWAYGWGYPYGYYGWGYPYGYYGWGYPYYSYYGWGYPLWWGGYAGYYTHRSYSSSRPIALRNTSLGRGARQATHTTASRGTFGGRSVASGTFGNSRTTSTSAQRSSGLRRNPSSAGSRVYSGGSSRTNSGTVSRSTSTPTRSYTPSSSSSSSRSSSSFGGGSSSRSSGSFGGGGGRSGGSFGGGGRGRR